MSEPRFAGSIPDVYQDVLVPMIFAPPAEVMADTVAALDPRDVLELAAGTGVLTRALRRRLAAPITATDLHAPMLETAQRIERLDEVTWQVADATALPFAAASYDVVAVQFGVMFLPDKVAAFAGIGRVLRPGGAFVLNAWDSHAANPIPRVVTEALTAEVGDDSLTFLEQIPHSYHDADRIAEDLTAAGFVADVERCEATIRTTARDAAVGHCQGTPLRARIEAHPALDLAAATDLAAAALVAHFGSAEFDASVRWLQAVGRSA